MKKDIGMKERLQNVKDRAAYIMATAYTTAAMAPVYAQSEGGGTKIEAVTINKEVDADTIVGQLMGIVLLIATFAGGVLLLWGMVMFALSVKTDEPESKQKAFLCCISGAVLLSLRAILGLAGIIADN